MRCHKHPVLEHLFCNSEPTKELLEIMRFGKLFLAITVMVVILAWGVNAETSVKPEKTTKKPEPITHSEKTKGGDPEPIKGSSTSESTKPEQTNNPGSFLIKIQQMVLQTFFPK